MKYKLLIISLLLAFSNAVFAQSEIPVQEMPADSVVLQDMAKNAEYFSKGLEEKYNENYPVAIYNFEQALLYYNDDDASMYELSELYQLDGRNTEAFSMISRAAELQPDNKWYQIRLAKFCAKNGDYQSFIAIYDKLLENEPENLDYLESYINVLLLMDDYDKVIEKLAVIEEQLGKNEYIYLQRIQIYDEQGKKDKAIEEMKKLVDFMPENTHYRALLAEAYRKVNRDKDAYKQYLEIQKIDPDDKYVNVSLLDFYWSNGDIDKAFKELISAIKNKNLDYDTKYQLTNLWFQRRALYITKEDIETVGNTFIESYPDDYYGYFLIGSFYTENKDYEKAKEYLLTSIDKGGNSYFVFSYLLNCYDQLKDYDNQIVYADKALEYYPSKQVFYVFKGVGYYNIKDYENCITTFEKVRKLFVDNNSLVLADTFIGDCYIYIKNNEKAYDSYDKVLKIEPENISVLNNYAFYLSLDNKDLDRALAMSEKTIQAEPKNPTYLDTYAWILYKLDRYDEALKYMNKVFKYDKNPQGINYEHLGDIQYKLGDTKNAMKNWKKAKKAGGEVSEFLDKKIKDEKLYE